jgi:hypothetical protein
VLSPAIASLAFVPSLVLVPSLARDGVRRWLLKMRRVRMQARVGGRAGVPEGRVDESKSGSGLAMAVAGRRCRRRRCLCGGLEAGRAAIDGMR